MAPEASLQGFLQAHCSMAIFTQGAHGASVLLRAGTRFSARAPQVKVVDTVGAGDCFTGAFLAAHLQGASAPEALELAVQAGTEAVQNQGARLSDEQQASLRKRLGAMLMLRS